MARRSKLSPGELIVARAVWERGSGAVGEIHAEVCRRQAMDYAAVQTYLRRLETKGVIAAQRDGRNKIYRPKIAASRVIRDTVADVLSRLFDGEVLSMMNHLVREQGIGRDEIAQLRRLLDEVEAANDDC